MPISSSFSPLGAGSSASRQSEPDRPGTGTSGPARKPARRSVLHRALIGLFLTITLIFTASYILFVYATIMDKTELAMISGYLLPKMGILFAIGLAAATMMSIQETD